MISQGNWRGYIEGLPAATIASELHTLCHAALFSKSSAEAVKFLEATQAKLVDAKAIPPELCSLLKKTMERADAVMSEGGWQAVQSDQTEPENVALPFPCGVFPPMLEQYLDSAAENVQVDRAMIGAAMLAACAPVSYTHLTLPTTSRV